MTFLPFSWSPHLSESLLRHWNRFEIPSISFDCTLGHHMDINKAITCLLLWKEIPLLAE